MRSFGFALGAALCIVVAALGPSCAILPREAGPAATDTQVVAETARQAQEQMALGNYKRALEIYSIARDKHRLPGLRQDHARLGEQIRAASDTAYQRGNFAEAGSAYRILFESGITKGDLAGSLSFDGDYVRGRMEACSKALMEIGLIKYREAKLDEAIAVWKKILVFDADNENVKKAIDTATTQLQRLKNIK